jgi:hypothetical protein
VLSARSWPEARTARKYCALQTTEAALCFSGTLQDRAAGPEMLAQSMRSRTSELRWNLDALVCDAIFD